MFFPREFTKNNILVNGPTVFFPFNGIFKLMLSELLLLFFITLSTLWKLWAE